MGLYLKIMLALFGLAYLISPVDIIPDLLVPFLGWVDDGFVLWTILHLIRYGELPWFFFKKKDWTSQSFKQKPPPERTGKKNKAHFSPGIDSESINSAHKILGVSANATWEEIQAAHKEKIKQYHPDKVSHLGEDFSNLANKKFLEIQGAYETLKMRH